MSFWGGELCSRLAKSIHSHIHAVFLVVLLLIIIMFLNEKLTFSEVVLPMVHCLFFELYIKIQGSLASLVFPERKHFLCSLELKNATIGVVFLFLPLKPRNIFFFLHWDYYWTIRWPVSPETKIFIVCKYFYGGSGEERGGLPYIHRLPYNFFF